MIHSSNSTAFQQWAAAWLQAVAKAWTVPAFKQRLVSNPRDALGDFNYSLPASVVLHVVDYSDPNHSKEVTPTAAFAAFDGGPPTTLYIPLLPAPTDLADGLVTLSTPPTVRTADCICVCF